MGPKVWACWDSLSKVKKKLLHVTFLIYWEEALGGTFWLLEAAYITYGNTDAAVLLGNMDSCQFKWVPEQENTLQQV